MESDFVLVIAFSSTWDEVYTMRKYSILLEYHILIVSLLREKKNGAIWLSVYLLSNVGFINPVKYLPWSSACL